MPPTRLKATGGSLSPMLSDTHPDAEKVQIDLLRKASTSERFALMCSLTATAINLSRRAIARANPTSSPREVDLKCEELHDGKQLAGRLRRYLETPPRGLG
jgi:hypothetical protein